MFGSGLTETAEGGLHRREIGVVGIDDERIVLRFAVFGTIVVRSVVLQRVVDGAQRHFETKSHQHSGQYIIYIIGTHELGVHFVPCAVFLSPTQREEGSALQHFAFDGIVVAGATVAQRGQTAFGHVGGEQIVVAVDKNEVRDGIGLEAGFAGDERFGEFGVALREIAVKFRFGLHHPFERTEAFEVRLAHIGDESAVGLHDFAQLCNFAGVIGTGFNNGKIMFRTQTE